jgi:pimeloyl-ACP methyl ester carboxylesterase
MSFDRVRRRLTEGEFGPFQKLALKSVAGAESETIAGAGHFSMMEASAAINARIARFIAERL